MPADRESELADLFEQERGRLFGIAYRMIGSVGDAEDIVQEAFTRYARRPDPSEIETPAAFLTTIVTRLAIDWLRSARVRRESYVGTWLPEPLLGAEEPVAARTELADSISMAFMVLLETLNPVERAVFLLHEAFDYSYAEIAEIVERSPDNCRQIALRARGHLEARRPRFEPSAARRDELARSFFTACSEGDAEALMQLLTDDVVMYGDGGGKAPAMRKPLAGAERVASTLIAFAAVGERLNARAELTLVNGQPGARYLTATGQLINVVSLEITEEGIRGIRSVVNPDKLGHLGEVADPFALIRESRAT